MLFQLQKSLLPTISTGIGFLAPSFGQRHLQQLLEFGEVTERNKQRKEIFHPLVLSPTSHNGQSWVSQKPETWNSEMAGSLTGVQGSTHLAHLLLLSQAYYQEAGYQMEQPRLKPVL